MTEPSYPSTRSGSTASTLLLLAVLIAGGATGWWLWTQRENPVETVAAPADPVVADIPEPEPPEPVEKVVKTLQVDTALNEWLSVPGIVKRLAAATWRVSNGRSPTPVLGFIVVEGRFKVKEDGDKMIIDPATYERYDPIIDRIVAVDPTQAARTYRRLRPNFEAAFREISKPGEKFHNVAKKAVARVLSVEVPPGEIEVVGKGATFFYADESLESLDQADKHVIRLGPNNAKRVQDWLRAVAREADLL